MHFKPLAIQGSIEETPISFPELLTLFLPFTEIVAAMSILMGGGASHAFSILRENNPRLNIIPSGEVTFATSSWAIVTSIDLAPIEETLIRTKSKIEELKVEMAKRTRDTHKPSLVTNQITRLIENLLSKLKHLKINGLRRRRGICNGCGTFIGGLFGLSTEEEIEKVKKSTNHLIEDQKNTIHVIDKQLTITKQINNNTVENRQRLLILENWLSNLDATINGFLQSPTTAMVQDVIITNVLMAEIAADISAFRSALLSAEMGKLQPDLVRPEILKETLEIIQKNTSLSNIIYDVETQLNQVYAASEVFVKAQGNKLHLIVKVPVKKMATDFQLFQVSSMPIPNAENSLFTIIEPEVPWFAVAHDRSLATTFKNEEIEKCIQLTTENWLCHPVKEFLKTPKNSCIWSIIVNAPEPPCQITVTDNFEPIFLKTTTGYKYAVPREIDLTINCPDKTDYHPVVKIKGTGMLSLKSGCSASSAEIYLTEINHPFETKLAVKSLYNISWSTIQTNQTRYLHKNTEFIHKLKKQNVIFPQTFLSLQKKIEELKKSTNTLEYFRFYTPEILWSSIFIVISILIISFIAHKCKRKEIKTPTNIPKAEYPLNYI